MEIDFSELRKQAPLPRRQTLWESVRQARGKGLKKEIIRTDWGPDVLPQLSSMTGNAKSNFDAIRLSRESQSGWTAIAVKGHPLMRFSNHR
jgi:hypothetical protein